MSTPIENDDDRIFQLLRRVKTDALSATQQSKLQLAESDTAGKQASILVADDSEVACACQP